MLEYRWSDKQPQELDDVVAAILDTERYPEQKVWSVSVKYILITLLSKLFHIKTTQAKVEAFYYQAKQLCRSLAAVDVQCCDAYLGGLDAMWPRLRYQLEDPGFYKFVCKYAMESAFLLPYFAVLSPYAPALEAAHGYSVDFGGTYRKVDLMEDPQAFGFVVGERTFRSFNFRALNHQVACLNLSMDMQASGLGKPSIFFAGGGMLPSVRYYYLRPENLQEYFERVVVYDKDPKMREYLKMVFEWPINEYGIEYYFDSFEMAFADECLWGKFDVVDCTGVMSYCQSDDDIDRALSGLASLLKPGGIMLFDRQVMTPDMIRCAVTLAWKTEPPLKPDLTVKRAIRRIEAAAERCDLNVECSFVDEYNTIPALVDFILQKPKS